MSDTRYHRVLPDGCTDLIFSFQRSSTEQGIYNPRLTIYGPTDRYNLVAIKLTAEFIGVRFKPGMAGVLQLSPLTLFQKQESVQNCAKHLIPLFNKLCECNSAKQALNTLQKNVLARIAAAECNIPVWTYEALQLIAMSDQPLRVLQIAQKVGVSERTLRRGLTTAVGVCPKVLVRILRFQKACALLRSQIPSKLSCIALESGYADQAHMGREFQEFSGLTPTAFIQR